MRHKTYIAAFLVVCLALAVACFAQDFWGYSGIIIGTGPPAPPSGGGPLAVTISCSPTVGPTTLTTACISVPTGGAPPYAYTWAWGDGTANSTTQNANHNFTVAATRTITLTVVDSGVPLAGTVSQVKTVLATGAAYYVAKSGSDSNVGTAAMPFLTLGKCQTAMQSGNKTCIINDSGTYTLGADFNFTSADNNEVWAAGFGQTPTISGNNAFALVTFGASPLSFYGLTFTNMQSTVSIGGFSNQHIGLSFGLSEANTTDGVKTINLRWNTITNTNGIQVQIFNSSGSLVDSNTFKNMTGPIGTAAADGPNGSGLLLWGTPVNNTFSHNFCTNLVGGCYTFGPGSEVHANNNSVTLNLATNLLQQGVDSGAFYYCDSCVGSGLGPSTGNSFTYNKVFGAQSSNTTGKGVAAFYLDQFTNNFVLKGNICNQCGDWAIHFNDLANTTVTQNIFDVSSLTANSGVTAAFGDGAGRGNTGSSFTNNIIYRSGSWPLYGGTIPSLWFELCNVGVCQGPATLNHNEYWSPTGNVSPTQGVTFGGNAANPQITDTPFNANPLFANPAANDYSLLSTSPAFSNISFPVLPTNQGPVNSPFVAAGSTF